MNSSVYKYLINDIFKQSRLPSLLDLSDDMVLPIVVALLESKSTDTSTGSYTMNQDWIILLTNAHKAILEIASGVPKETHPFKNNGASLAIVLIYCIHNDKPLIVSDTSTSLCAMFCFLLEGFLCAGWCPAEYESDAKRAAHSYFFLVKKSLHRHLDIPLALPYWYLQKAYYWGSKTDNTITQNDVQDHNESINATVDLSVINQSVLIIKQLNPLLFYCIKYQGNKIPHPVYTIFRPDDAGISLEINSYPVTVCQLTNYTEINRLKIAGHTFVYTCQTQNGDHFCWTIAILHFENTIYRVDTIIFSKESAADIQISVTYKLECPAIPNKIKKDSYYAKDTENTVIVFVQNPLQGEYQDFHESGIATFSSPARTISAHQPLTLITAWSKGKGITGINETKLLGIYD